MLLDPERAARVAYAAVRQLREEQGDRRGPVWEMLVPRERLWYRTAVSRVASGVSLSEVHAEWCEFLEADGWAYGPVEDHVKRTHPGLAPWSSLPESLRRRLFLLQMITMGMALEVGSSSPVTAA